MRSTASEDSGAIIIGIDVGGTFTDAVAADGSGRIISTKTPSTPPDYERGVLTALDELATRFGISTRKMLGRTQYIAHGTTSSLNALIQRKVGDVGLLTTKGHRDSLFIMNVEGRYLGRSSHEIQDVLRRRKPQPLVPKHRVKEIEERIDYSGAVVVGLDEAQARAAIEELIAEGVDGIAVSLLWAFQNPVHERRLGELVREYSSSLYVGLSSDVTPRIREFARTATTVMSTQIGPALQDYLAPLESELVGRGLSGRLLVMQSSGGTVPADEAPRQAITTVGSVLCGGVVGTQRLATQLGHRNIIATDVGGTTFLAGLVVEGEPVRATTTIINQHPVNVPTLRVHAIGSGGGAIAWVDDGGNIRVGPHSAEAVPGPACYGQGGEHPTNTDANLVLGILDGRGLLGGRRPLQRELAERAIRRDIADPLGIDVEEAAAAIYAIQNAQTGDHLRRVVVEAGHDPRDFVIYAFGGAGPAHAASYGAEIGVTEVVVPLGPVASAFSAYGLALSDLVLTAELSDPSQFPTAAARVQENFERLEHDLRTRIQGQRIGSTVTEVVREVDLRYTMQSVEVEVPVPSGRLSDDDIARTVQRFDEKYEQLNGPNSGYRDAGVQAITYRVRMTAELPFSMELPPIRPALGQDPFDAEIERRSVLLDPLRGFEKTPVYDYERLGSGHVIDGPALVQETATTVVIPGGVVGNIDTYGNLVMRGQDGAQSR